MHEFSKRKVKRIFELTRSWIADGLNWTQPCRCVVVLKET